MKHLKRISAVFLFALLTAPAAFAYYCPSTGHWLNRDPLGDESFLREQTKWKNWHAQKHLVEHGKRPNYLFVNNTPIARFDSYGLFDPNDFKWYGNWCGPKWTAGQSINAKDYDWEDDPRPDVVDDLDKCCRKHDACYANWDLDKHEQLQGQVDKKACDKGLCECAQSSKMTAQNSSANLGIQCIFCDKYYEKPPPPGQPPEMGCNCIIIFGKRF